MVRLKRVNHARSGSALASAVLVVMETVQGLAYGTKPLTQVQTRELMPAVSSALATAEL
jgi:hypothetical protein